MEYDYYCLNFDLFFIFMIKNLLNPDVILIFQILAL